MSTSARCERCNQFLSKCKCGHTYTYDHSEGAICPYCGHMNEAIESDGLLYTEDTTSYYCDSCDKQFYVGVNISYSWTATRIEGVTCNTDDTNIEVDDDADDTEYDED